MATQFVKRESEDEPVAAKRARNALDNLTPPEIFGEDVYEEARRVRQEIEDEMRRTQKDPARSPDALVKCDFEENRAILRKNGFGVKECGIYYKVEWTRKARPAAAAAPAAKNELTDVKVKQEP